MSQPGGDDFLIDLFREEVRTHSQVLTEGLVAVEQGGAGPRAAGSDDACGPLDQGRGPRGERAAGRRESRTPWRTASSAPRRPN